MGGRFLPLIGACLEPRARLRWRWLTSNPLSTGLVIAGIVVAVLIGLGLLSMVAMMAFMGPSMGWHC